MEQTFQGKNAIITGAANGIGNAVAKYLAARGATIVGVDMSNAVLTIGQSLDGGGHHGIVADLTDTAAAKRVVQESVETVGLPHILVNSAGIALLDSALDVTVDRWQKTLDVNLSGTFFMAQAAGAVMTEAGFGRIINLASQASVIGLDQHVAYCASKAAVLGVTRVLAMEWASRGVTVNAVSPTVVETALGKAAWAGEKGEKAKREIPVGRFAQPDEVAAMVAYLASDVAAMVTGSNMLLDGGFTMI